MEKNSQHKETRNIKAEQLRNRFWVLKSDDKKNVIKKK